jgi:HAD superfamily hydrolase (TIGR01549 family)
MGVELARVKGLCFDVDGTLSDTDDAWVERINHWLRPLRFLFARGETRHFARWLVMVTETPMNNLYYLADRMSLDDNFARFFERLARRPNRDHKFYLMRGATELLNFVQERYPLSVVSARDERSTMRFLDQFLLTSRFRCIVTSQTCEHTKPFPDPVIHAANQMNVRPEDCLMIGDTTVDVLAGKRAGAQTVGLLCGFGTEGELRKAGADLVLNDLAELLALFKAE